MVVEDTLESHILVFIQKFLTFMLILYSSTVLLILLYTVQNLVGTLLTLIVWW